MNNMNKNKDKRVMIIIMIRWVFFIEKMRIQIGASFRSRSDSNHKTNRK